MVSGFLVFGAQEQPAAQPMDNPGPKQPNAVADKEKPKYAPGRFIVKFKSEGPEAVNEDVEYLLERNGKFKDAVSDKSDSLDKLKGKHKIQKAKSVFIERHGLTTRDAREKQGQMRQLSKVRHQSRSRRAPKDVTLPDLSNIYVIDVPPESDIEAIVQEFQADPHVEYAQPDYLKTLDMVPNDPYYSSYGSWGQTYDDLWGLKKIQVEQAWDITQGEGIVVAVVDTGLDYNHPDIADNVWVNPCEDLNHNGIADPGDFNGADDACAGEEPNGYVDDVRGWDFANRDNDPMDGFEHGTHVSGTIAAVGNNGIGIIGVAPKAKIMPVKGMNTFSGWSSDLSKGIKYAAQNGADVINNSWGCEGGCPSDPEVEDAVRTAYGLGAVVVFGAGNDSLDVAGESPGNMTDSKPVVVSATTDLDVPAYFTDFGVTVDVSAPGTNILSLSLNSSGYVKHSGTSMAAPHVAGAAALVLASHPAFTNEQVRQVLRASADDINSAGFDAKFGTGRINAARALTISTPLSAKITSPTAKSVYSPNQTIMFTGTASGADFKQYELFYRIGVEPTWVSLGGPMSTPVENAMLGIWNTLDFLDSDILMRLVVTSASDMQFDDMVSFNINNFKKITTNSSNQGTASISGNLIVWSDDRNGNADIYLYDLNTNTEKQITTNSSSQYNPAISGNLVVWQDYRNGNNDIYLYDLDTKTEKQITTNSSSQYNPAISGNLVVWQDYRNGNNDIYLYDLDTKTEKQITTNSSSQYNPAISGNLVVWQDDRNGSLYSSKDIYLYDISAGAEKRIATNASWSEKRDPDISGNVIVWWDDRHDSGDIYLYDLNAETEKRITTNSAEQMFPDISGNLIVWRDDRNGGLNYNNDIYLYDLSTGTEKRITVNSLDQGFPDISGNVIVWTDNRHGNNDIYSYSLPPSICGDNICTPDEGYQKCQMDCPSQRCGDGFCSAADNENGTTCQPDCSVTCGDGICQADEDTIRCQIDCLPPGCGDGICTPDEGYMKCERDCPSQRCGDGFCSAMDYEDGQNCQPDCTITCGDGICTPDEGYMKCEMDCPSMRCGDGFCSAMDYEDGQNCQPDCTITCGDGICTPDEGYMKCERDCPSMRCGDGVCSVIDGENETTCGPDCRPPELAPVGNKTINEGETLTFTVAATDPTGDVLTYTAAGLPTGATFNGQIFAWTPDSAQAGAYDVLFIVSDGVLTDVETITIIVLNVNQPPVLAAIGNKSVNEGQLLSFTVQASDPDGDSLGWKLGSLPDVNGDGFIDRADVERITALFGQTVDTDEERLADLDADGTITIADVRGGTKSVPFAYRVFQVSTGTFNWTPDYSQGGNYAVTFTVSDGTLTAAETVAISVVNVNQTPLLNPVGNQTVNESQLLSFTVQASDPDGDPLIWKLGSLPDVNADGFIDWTDVDRILALYGQVVDTDEERRADIYPDGIIDIADVQGGINSLPAPYVVGLFETANGTFRWTPGYDQAGSRNVTFRVSDGALSTGETITITVADVPAPDLVTYTISTAASVVIPGNKFTLSNTVKNQGLASAAGFTVAFSLSKDTTYGGTDDIVLTATRSVTSLAAGANSSASTSLTVPATTPLGSYYVCARADSGGTVQESAETNNSRCTTSPVQIALLDLFMNAVSGPSATTTGKSFTVSYSVTNQGESSANKFYVGIYFSTDANITSSDNLIAGEWITSLAGGATLTKNRTITLSTSIYPGTFYLGAIADRDYRVQETNEGNNALTGNIMTVTSGVDLVMNSVSGPSSAVRGTTAVNLGGSLTNQGVSNPTTFYVGFYLSSDATITTSDIYIGRVYFTTLSPGLTATASINTTMPTSVPAGTYYVGAVADYQNLTKENNETNNARAGNTIMVQ